MASSLRVTVDETTIQNGAETEWYCLYAAGDLDSSYLLDIDVFSHHGIDPAAAFLHELKKYDVAEINFLVDGYRTDLPRIDLSDQIKYSDRNHIEKWFHTFKMRTDRFHTCWVGSQPAATEWYQLFKRYYNQQRPNQLLNGKIPAEVLN